MSKFARLMAVIAVVTLVSACGKQDEKQQGVNDEQIKNFILNNPEVIVQSMENYQKKMMEDQTRNAEENLSKYRSEIYNDKNSPVYGNPNGKIQVVEFFDYNCGYCKKMLPDIIRLVSENKDVKVIFKELPVLDKTSENAALVALAIHDLAPEKYFAFHSALMEFKGLKTDEAIKAAADKAGTNGAEMLEKAKSDKYRAMLMENTKIAEALAIQGTPTFIVNDKIFRGAMGYEGLKQIVDGAKK